MNPARERHDGLHEPGETPESFLRRVDDGLHDAKLDAHPERRARTNLARSPTDRSLEPVFAAGLDDDDGAASASRRGPRIAVGRTDGHDARIAWLLAAAGAFVPALILIGDLRVEHRAGPRQPRGRRC